MNIAQAVQKASIDNDIKGIMELVEHCGIPYPRVYRVWHGETNAKIADVISVLSSVGLKLKIEKIEKEEKES